MQTLMGFLPTVAVVLTVVLVLAVVHRIGRSGATAASGKSFRYQLLMFLLGLLGMILVVLVLPVSDTLRGQILSLLGIVISAAIALSSTTILGNAMAGFMLRVVRGFRIGDFVETGEHFGRVSEQGLFHTEIQTENRDLTTLPNLFLVNHPVTTIRTSGTIVSTTVSLGYDVPRALIEELLLEAARSCNLDDPFVQVLSLGDFSVSYRIAGLLTEVKQVLTVRSRLRAAVMDALHGGGVEIVSPNFMNQRVLEKDRVFIPARGRKEASTVETAAAEKLAFDKADEAESLLVLQERSKALGDEIDELKSELKAVADENLRPQLDERIQVLERRRDRLAKLIMDRENAVGDQ